MRYALIREMDVSNGRGVGISLFVQGCHFHCKGCFNPETWDFSGGKEWTQETEDRFIELARRPYIMRISILGGEPLADENVPGVLKLINRIREEYGCHKDIWLYTGYRYDDIVKARCESDIANDRFECVLMSNIIVDGQFDIEKQDTFNKEIVFAGSTNQRIIDVQQSLVWGECCELVKEG